MARYTCADCGEPTDNYSLICDVCAPEYFDDTQPDGVRTLAAPGWAEETKAELLRKEASQ